ncbi:hypothetical protein SFRURICE_012920 [Spodoptera frugiperda]|nr:hypothetical protein SFRURICE_012920 [Spodoptera frugiperda]
MSKDIIKSLTANRKLWEANPPLTSVTGDHHGVQCAKNVQNQDIIFPNNTSSQSNVQNKGVYRLRRQTLDGGWCDTAHALASAGDSCTWSGSSTLTIRFT